MRTSRAWETISENIETSYKGSSELPRVKEEQAIVHKEGTKLLAKKIRPVEMFQNPN
jgi:hypothetical protein